MASAKIAFYIYYLLIISPGIHGYVYYMVFAKLLKKKKKKKSTNITSKVHISEVCDHEVTLVMCQFQNYAVHINGDFLCKASPTNFVGSDYRKYPFNQVHFYDN